MDLKALKGAKSSKAAAPSKSKKRGLLADDALRLRSVPSAVPVATSTSHAAPSQGSAKAPRQSEADASRPPAASTEPSSVVESEYKLFHLVADDGGLAALDDGSRGWHSALWHGCADLSAWRRLNTINEGSYGVVYRAQHTSTQEIVAIKEVKLSVSANDGFPVTALRELNALLSLRHENIVRAHVMAMPKLAPAAAAASISKSWSPESQGALPGTYGRCSTDSVFMVMEYLPHDLRALMDAMTQPFPLAEVKTLLRQLLLATEHMHANGWLHRDLKTANLLLDNAGRLVVCDLGLARQYTSPARQYTAEVVSMWYRAPEVLLGDAKYGPALDMWSCGCIFGEMLTKHYLLQGTSESNQLKRIFEMVGSPSAESWPGFEALRGAGALPKSLLGLQGGAACLRKGLGLPEHAFAGAYLPPAGLDLLGKLLQLDPAQRITAADALRHPFWEETPLPRARHLMRSAPETNKQRHGSKQLRVERNTLMYGLDDE